MIISDPGIYDISEDDYRADPCPEPSLSYSLAKIMLEKSPAHAWLRHPKNESYSAQKSNDAFDFGTAAHALCLRGLDIMEVVDADDWKTKASRELRDDIRARGKIPLLQKNAHVIARMKIELDRAIKCNPDFNGITLDHGKAEQSVIWREGSIWCRSRVDWLHDENLLLIDYKTVGQSANPQNFARTIINYGYDIQAGFYQRGVISVIPSALPKYVIIAQETEEPYAVSFNGVGGQLLDLGRDKAEMAIRMWKQCIKSGEFWGYPNRICWTECPSFAMSRWNESSLGEGVIQ